MNCILLYALQEMLIICFFKGTDQGTEHVSWQGLSPACPSGAESEQFDDEAIEKRRHRVLRNMSGDCDVIDDRMVSLVPI